ncbi:hypothetical protein [Aliiroseovarius crassostreae]|uniref:hypothetical protein n=1 Tax=Aliiroseovarius crassostreae TaxID=154981 RepID=UPI003C7C8887
MNAAFRLRAVLPFGSISLPAASEHAAQPQKLMGVQITPRHRSPGRVHIRVKELWTLRHALLREAGFGRKDSRRLWRTHFRNMTCHGVTRLLDQIGSSPLPNRRPDGGGIVLAVRGTDGVGKSTQLNALYTTLSPLFGTRRFYLGSSGILSSIVFALRGPAQPSDACISEAKGQTTGLRETCEDVARAVWGLWLALYRLYILHRTHSLARRGYIVLCDRWPQNLERGLLDGPIRRKTVKTWPWIDRLFAVETRLYRRMKRYAPDLTIHLMAPYDVTEARKPGELTPQTHAQRQALLHAMRRQDPSIVVMNSNRSFDEVHNDLMQTLWGRLAVGGTGDQTQNRRPENQNLRRPLNHAISGQVVHTLGQLAILTSISHLQGVSAVGAFGLALSLVTPVFILANMGLRTTQAIDQEREFSFADYAGFRVVTTFAALLTCILLGFALTGGGPVLPIILLYAVAKGFESISSLSYGTFLTHERVDLVFRSYLYRSVLTALVFFCLLWMGLPLWAAFLAQILVWASVALILDLPMAWQLNDRGPAQIRITWPLIRSIARRTFPIGGTGFLIGLQPALLRLFVESYFGLAALGVFTNVSAVFQAGAMVSNSIRHFLAARFTKLRLQADFSATYNTTFILLVSILGVSLLGIFFVYQLGAPLLHLAFGAETAQHETLLLIVTIALTFRMLNAVTGSLNHAYGRAVSLFVREGFYVLVLIILSWLIIPQSGLVGAGAVILVISMLRFVADGLAFALTRPRLRQEKEV